MSTNELKKVYEDADKSAFFFDQLTPVDLFRRRNIGDKTALMQPTLIGFDRKNDPEPRHPDIWISDDNRKSPQYKDGGANPQDRDNQMVRESNSKPFTRQLIGDASRYIVKGCRTIKGDYRGVSMFDMKNELARNAEWFVLEKNTEIPDGIAITQDGNKRKGVSLHYTVAPKDDMPLALFLQHLKGFEAKLRKQGTE